MGLDVWQRLQASPGNSGATAILEEGGRDNIPGMTTVDSLVHRAAKFQTSRHRPRLRRAADQAGDRGCDRWRGNGADGLTVPQRPGLRVL